MLFMTVLLFCAHIWTLFLKDFLPCVGYTYCLSVGGATVHLRCLREHLQNLL